MLHFDPNQQEIYFANDDVLQVIPALLFSSLKSTGHSKVPLHSLGLVVFKLDVQTVLNAHFHLDCVVDFWFWRIVVHPEVHLLITR